MPRLRLDERRRPEPDVPDHVGVGGDGAARHRHGGLRLLELASGTYAWTSRLAQQVLQSDFDPHLVRLFDKQAQGWVGQSVVEAGEQPVGVDQRPVDAWRSRRR